MVEAVNIRLKLWTPWIPNHRWIAKSTSHNYFLFFIAKNLSPSRKRRGSFLGKTRAIKAFPFHFELEVDTESSNLLQTWTCTVFSTESIVRMFNISGRAACKQLESIFSCHGGEKWNRLRGEIMNYHIYLSSKIVKNSCMHAFGLWTAVEEFSSIRSQSSNVLVNTKNVYWKQSRSSFILIDSS